LTKEENARNEELKMVRNSLRKWRIYVVLSSDKSSSYFPNNTPYRFKSHVNAPLLVNIC